MGQVPRRGVYVCVCLILVIFYGFLFCLFLNGFFYGISFLPGKKKMNTHTSPPCKVRKRNMSAREESWLLVMKFFNIHTFIIYLFIFLFIYLIIWHLHLWVSPFILWVLELDLRSSSLVHPLNHCMGPNNGTEFFIIDGVSFKTSVAGKQLVCCFRFRGYQSFLLRMLGDFR